MYAVNFTPFKLICSFYLNLFHPFTWFAKPLGLSPLYCAQYGWENSEVDILQCVSCKACLDATISTTWDSEICELHMILLMNL